MTTETKYQHVIQAVFNQPWAILPSVYATICEIVRMRSQGEWFSDEEIQARIGAAPVRAGAARNGSVAVLPLYGIIAQRMSLMADMSGGVSTEQFGKAFQAALSDPEVSAIVIDVDSPGGSVSGVAELAQSIFDARGRKPIIAQANSMAASAAYWISSAAEEVVVTPGGEVGSIGVIAHHQDISGLEEMQGVKDTLITYGDNKGIGNPFEPLSDEARGYIQKRVNEYGAMFDQAVARGRGVSAAKVRSDFGQGLMFGAQEAVKLGMADRVGTLQQTIERLMGRGSRGGARAEAPIYAGIDLAMVEFSDAPDAVRSEEPEGLVLVETDEHEVEVLALRARRLRL